MSMIPIIDAHQHFWDLEANYHPWLRDRPKLHRYGDTTALRRNYLPPDYLRDAARQNVIGSVYVEAEWDPNDPLGETRWVHEIAARFGYPHAMVCQAWLDDDVEPVLAAQARYPLVRGVRHKPRTVAPGQPIPLGAPGSMSCPQWRRGYARLAHHGLHFELQAPWWHLGEARDLVREFPQTTLILNHSGLPADRTAAGLQGWREALATLAAEPNAAVKISGLGRPDAPWTEQDNCPIVKDVIRIFGVRRCMFASNFPVDALVADFDTIYDGFRRIIAELPVEDQHLLLHANAARYYRTSRGDVQADNRLQL